MFSRPSLPMLTLAALALQAAFANSAHAQDGATFYDRQTATSGNIQQASVEGMAWGYFHTGPLTQTLTISPGDPVAIQLYDSDEDEQYV